MHIVQLFFNFYFIFIFKSNYLKTNNYFFILQPMNINNCMCNCGNKFNQSLHQYNQSVRNASNIQNTQSRQIPTNSQNLTKNTTQSRNNLNYEMYLKSQRRYF